MIIVVALNRQHFNAFCDDHDPPLNPRSRDLVFLSTDRADGAQATRGRRLTDEDRVICYGPWYAGKYASDVTAIINTVSSGWKGKIEYA